jgi:hypothetical protein
MRPIRFLPQAAILSNLRAVSLLAGATTPGNGGSCQRRIFHYR